MHSGYKPLVKYIICKYFLPFRELSFHFVHGILWRTFLISSVYLFFSHTFGVISKNLLHNSRLQRFTSVFSSKSLWSHIFVCDPLWINFCILCEVRVQRHSCVCGYPVVSASFAEKTIIFLLNDLGTLVKNICVCKRAYFQALYFVPLLHVSVFMPVLHCFAY